MLVQGARLTTLAATINLDAKRRFDPGRGKAGLAPIRQLAGALQIQLKRLSTETRSAAS